MRPSEDPVDHYRQQGYVTMSNGLPSDEFEDLQAYFEQRFASLGEGERPEDMDVPHFDDPTVFRWILNDELLDTVERFIGPDIAVFSSHFFCKPAHDGKPVPWHQDAYFWQRQISPATKALTVWLAIDPSDRANGCMKVIPATHRQGILGHGALDDERFVFDERLDTTYSTSSPTLVELSPNEMSVHSAALVHSSEPNTSDRRRCGFTMRYMSTSVRFKHEEAGSYHQVYLARGRDRAGNRYGDPTRRYPELLAARSTLTKG